MTEEQENVTENAEVEAPPVRVESFTVDGPIEIDLSIGAGKVLVHLTNEPGASVEVRHDPGEQSPWAQGLSSLMNWVNDQFAEASTESSPTAAIDETRIDLTGGRLVVRTPKTLPLRGIPLAVTVRAPAGSHVTGRSGTAAFTVTGPAGRLDVSSGSGDIAADRGDGSAAISTGSGTVRLGPMLGGLRARTGSGDMEVSSVAGPTSLHTGTGDVWLGAVAGDVMARTGSGDLTVADAGSGRIELITGTGEIRVGIRQGVTAEVDLTSGTAKATSELEVQREKPSGEVAVQLRGRTGAGMAIVTAAVE
jgi:putative adhesin